MKIVLINPKVIENGFNQFGGEKGWLGEPLSLGYLASYLRQFGYEVEILDANLYGYDSAKTAEMVVQRKPDLVGITTKFYNIPQTMTICRYLRKHLPDCHITLGGYFATFHYQEILQDLNITDTIVLGEGEETLREIAEAIATGRDDWSEVPGLACKQDDQIILSPPRPLLDNLDLLPFPARDHIQTGRKEGSLVQMSASRGCYGTCAYCVIGEFFNHQPGRKWRYRSAKNIVDEIAYLQKEHGVSFIEFVDDTFIGPGNVGKARMEMLAQEIAEQGIEIEFSILTRPNEISYDVIKRLHDVGLRYVFVGIESGHQRGLDTFRKGTTVEQNINAIQVLQEVGVHFQMGLIYFDPYTTLEECTENLDFLERLGLQAHMSTLGSMLEIFPGTALEKRLTKENNLQENFPSYEYKFVDSRVETLRQIFRQNKTNPDLHIPVIWIQEFLALNRKREKPLPHAELYQILEDAIAIKTQTDINFMRRAITYVSEGCTGILQPVPVIGERDRVKQKLDLIYKMLHTN